MSVGRDDAALLVIVTGALRNPNRNAAGKRHAALTVQQRLAGDMDGNQRR